MKQLPGALFIVDPRKERIAVAEAKKAWAFRLLRLLTRTATRTRLTT